MSRGASLQLPDLLALTRDFELHINPHCRVVSDAVEAWWIDPRNATMFAPNNGEDLRNMKAGLLAALVLPASDSPQLTLVAHFLTALLYFQQRMATATSLVDCGWEHLSESNGLSFLDSNKVFHLFIPHLNRLSSHAPDDWRTRFNASITAFQFATPSLVSASGEPTACRDIDTYIRQKMSASGTRMLIDLMELVKELRLPSSYFEQSDAMLTSLVETTVCILTWSLDIVSYNIHQSYGSKTNAINVIVKTMQLTTQGALKFAHAQLKQQFEQFKLVERAILDGLASVHAPHHRPQAPRHRSVSPPGASAPPARTPWSWVPTTLFSSSKPPSPDPSPPKPIFEPDDHWDEQTCDDMRAYMQGLRDCIVGFVHWTYETDIYFGKHGEEVRNTGWMFMLPPVCSTKRS
ncbi:hypothetical protein HGRIS_010850 [Hohenbuehelia grisea]|uniref:Uncharacterized protein n=1 Tax=Hohenbuehelia grisea TaxID=104357 RepID=A0ABR3IYB1_9AGAR